MYVARNKMTDKKDKTDNGYHLIVLAKNEKVIIIYANL